AKTHNYLNLILADREVKRANPDAWSVLLDEHGNLCEGVGSNIFVVRGGRVYTPREQYVLPGVSRRTAMEMAAQLGIPCEERDLDVYDAVTAAVVFVHGGAWARLDRTADPILCGALAASGAVVIALDFRQAPDHRYPAASADVAAGMRYARAHAPRLGVDPARIGILGSSSGGLLSL